METLIRGHLEKAMDEYSNGAHYETLLEAKKEYFSLTGQVNEEDEDYEPRMNLFNDWYVCQYISQRHTRTVLKDYLTRYQIEDGISKSLLNINHSLFEYRGVGLKKRDILQDILHGGKIHLARDHHRLSLLKNDLFIGRLVEVKGLSYLLSGVCVLPKDVRSILVKQSKKIRKLKDPNKEREFLLKTEYLKTRWARYGHIDATKIFSFEDS